MNIVQDRSTPPAKPNHSAGQPADLPAVDDWLLDRLLAFDARSEDREGGGHGESDDEWADHHAR